MEGWRLMLGLSILLVLYGIIITFTGEDASVLDLVLLVLFGIAGFYLGEIFSSRLTSNREN